MIKSFLNKLNLKPYSDSMENRRLWYPKPDVSILTKTGWSGFYDFGYLLDFLLSWSLDAF
jgi:hypothetical protein